MIFRQLYDAQSSTYTYLLGCPESREAILIDPVYEQFNRDAALLRELGLRVRYTLDTHVHADHVTAAWKLKQNLGADIALSARYAIPEVDIALGDGDVLSFGNHSVTALHTPGHTVGCMCFVTRDRDRVFTGDALLIRAAGRTDFQGGDVHSMWRSIREVLFALPDACLVYPGHDYNGRTVSTIGEEKRFNPRIGGDAREEDFVGYMNNLGLPHPRLLDIAVPANLHCGKPAFDAAAPEPAWAPIVTSFAGVPELEPDWIARHLDDVMLLDVRTPAEFNGDLGHVDSATLIPLDELRDRLEEVPRDKPVTVICQSGKRSAMAVQILQKAGVERVANSSGGMLQWVRLGLPHRTR
ncbi:MAG: MBL fold metallo-hydrolase [Pseudomonadales bacterium]